MRGQSISDKLGLIRENIAAIESYVQPIHAVNDFYVGPGAMIFDAILMRLQALGEKI